MPAKAKSKTASSRTPPKSLGDYMKDKERAGCEVCKLDISIRGQLGRSASKRDFSREDQAEWLRTECGATGVTQEILNKHLSAKHDRPEDFPS